MAWTVYKPADCLLGKQHKEEQKQEPQKANSATVAAAATTALHPCYVALMATMANLEKWWCMPACMYYMLLACMAGPNDTGQQIMTHLFLHLLQIIIFNLTLIAIPRKQALIHTLVVTVQKKAAWRLKGRALP
jgi:hypothetical protein